VLSLVRPIISEDVTHGIVNRFRQFVVCLALLPVWFMQHDVCPANQVEQFWLTQSNPSESRHIAQWTLAFISLAQYAAFARCVLADDFLQSCCCKVYDFGF